MQHVAMSGNVKSSSYRYSFWDIDVQKCFSRNVANNNVAGQQFAGGHFCYEAHFTLKC